MSLRKADLDLLGNTSGQFKTTCPFCSPTRKKNTEPCLSVNLDLAVYDCHHCGEVGRIVDIIPTKAFAAKDKEYKAPNVEDLQKHALEFDSTFLDYMHGRGITDEVLAEAQISYGKSFPEYDMTKTLANGRHPIKLDDQGIPIFHPGIRFPFYEYGKLVAMKHLQPPQWSPDGQRHTRFSKDGKLVPFGFDDAGSQIVITEGEIDKLSWMTAIKQVGIWSVPNGSKNLNWLEFSSVVHKLTEANDIYLAGDADEEGLIMRAELIRRLSLLVGPEKLWVVNYPLDCKDPNDVLVKYGPEKLKECFENAEPLPVDGISEVREFAPEFMDYYLNGLPKGMPTGIPNLDEIYRIMPGGVTVVTGITNYGKSEFVDEIIRLQIMLHGSSFALYTPENAPHSLHLLKVAEKLVGKPFDRARGGHMSEDEARTVLDWMQNHLFYINPRAQTFSVDEILERARILIYRKGITGLIIDPWNYVRKDFGSLREDQFINQEMQKIGVFAKATNVHVWVIVHPRTLRKNKDGKLEVPTVMELSGGSKYGDNADFLLAIHRDPKKADETGIHEVTIYNQKSRYRHIARQGEVMVEWEPFNGRFKAAGAATFAPVEDEFVGAVEVDDDAF